MTLGNLSELDLLSYRQRLIDVERLKPATINQRVNALRWLCRSKVFQPLKAREEIQSSALRVLTKRLFEGSANLVLARLVAEEEITLEELDDRRRQVKCRQSEGGPR